MLSDLVSSERLVGKTMNRSKVLPCGNILNGVAGPKNTRNFSANQTWRVDNYDSSGDESRSSSPDRLKEPKYQVKFEAGNDYDSIGKNRPSRKSRSSDYLDRLLESRNTCSKMASKYPNETSVNLRRKKSFDCMDTLLMNNDHCDKLDKLNATNKQNNRKRDKRCRERRSADYLDVLLADDSDENRMSNYKLSNSKYRGEKRSGDYLDHLLSKDFNEAPKDFTRPFGQKGRYCTGSSQESSDDDERQQTRMDLTGNEDGDESDDGDYFKCSSNKRDKPRNDVEKFSSMSYKSVITRKESFERESGTLMTSVEVKRLECYRESVEAKTASAFEEPGSDSESESDSEFYRKLRQNQKSNKEEPKFHPNYAGPTVRNEVAFTDLPAIEELKDLNLEDDAYMQIIGHVMSVVGFMVIIKSANEAMALDAETVLFHEDKTAFGQVFEVFGPVKDPFYIVRFNNESEVKSKGVKVGMPVYCCLSDFDMTKVVFQTDLDQMKGSDASWRNDHEPPEGALAYSDDEQEREARRSLALKKRQNREDASLLEENTVDISSESGNSGSDGEIKSDSETEAEVKRNKKQRKSKTVNKKLSKNSEDRLDENISGLPLKVCRPMGMALPDADDSITLKTEKQRHRRRKMEDKSHGKNQRNPFWDNPMKPVAKVGYIEPIDVLYMKEMEKKKGVPKRNVSFPDPPPPPLKDWMAPVTSFASSSISNYQWSEQSPLGFQNKPPNSSSANFSMQPIMSCDPNAIASRNRPLNSNSGSNSAPSLMPPQESMNFAPTMPPPPMPPPHSMPMSFNNGNENPLYRGNIMSTTPRNVFAPPPYESNFRPPPLMMANQASQGSNFGILRPPVFPGNQNVTPNFPIRGPNFGNFLPPPAPRGLVVSNVSFGNNMGVGISNTVNVNSRMAPPFFAASSVLAGNQQQSLFGRPPVPVAAFNKTY